MISCTSIFNSSRIDCTWRYKKGWAFLGQVASTIAWKTAHQGKLLKSSLEYQGSSLIFKGLALTSMCILWMKLVSQLWFFYYCFSEQEFGTRSSLGEQKNICPVLKFMQLLAAWSLYLLRCIVSRAALVLLLEFINAAYNSFQGVRDCLISICQAGTSVH